MRIPNIFIPDYKNLDGKLKELESGKSSKIKQVNDMFSLTCLPEKIGYYALRTDFEEITKDRWEFHFGKRIPKYLLKAGEITYIPPLSSVFTSIYVLEFKNGTDLNKLNREIKLEKEISKISDAIRTKCLKKGNYLVAIKTNHTDKYSRDIFGNWYLNNFDLEVL